MGKIIMSRVKGMSWGMKISLVLFFTICLSTFMYQGWYNPIQTQAAAVTYNLQANSGTSVATGVTTNTSCGSSTSSRITLMSTAAQNCSSANVQLSGTGIMLEAYNNTAYASAVKVTGSSLTVRLRDDSSGGWQAGIQLFYVNSAGVKTNFTGAEVTQSVPSGGNIDYTISLSGQSANVPAGSKLGIRVRAISGNSDKKRVYWGKSASTTSGASGILKVDEVSDSTPPLVGSLSVFPQAGSFVPSAFTITGNFTDNESPVTVCEYTLNGGTTWSGGTVSGTGTSYTCTANVTGQANGAALAINMRATSSGGTSTPATPLSRTVDAAAPVDGSLSVAPGMGQNGLSWSSANDTGSGLASTNTYMVVYQAGSVAPANCNAGTQIYVGSDPTYTHTGLTNGTAYSYRICAYDNVGNASTGATGSGTPINNPNITTTGTCTAAQTGIGISVAMPFTGDANDNNTYTVDYKLSSSSTWTNWVANAPHATSPYATIINGLADGQTYDVRCTFNDADGVSGANAQIITGITITNNMLHNSKNTDSSLWGAAGWGISGGKYGVIVCQTCHEPRATEIKGIKSKITAPNGTDQFPGQAGGSTVIFQSTAAGANRFGDDTTSHSSSSRICEYCHSLTSVHKYNQPTVAQHETPIGSPDCTMCHKHDKGFKPAGGCTLCHQVQLGNRAAVVGLFSSNSHHIQGVALTDQHCYQCHWEANPDGSINSAYHGGSANPGAPVRLVIYGNGVRPATYTVGTTAIEYTANGSRTEIAKINQHCLGCHSSQNNTTQPFGDGKTPKQYSWDGLSIAERYSQTGTTPWGKYSGANVTPKNTQTKAFSAHGNAAANQRGWNLTETWPNTAGTVNVVCYDCHNSHGSTVSGTTTSYASATTNGGLLKDTSAGTGGYTMTYKPQAGGSAADHNVYNPGAAICFDCHMTQNAGTTPWGYQGTYGATQMILGYFDTPYFDLGKTGPQQRYAYKALAGQPKGGHLGASSSLSTPVMGTIGGLCTPCHDPHGVSPTLGANQAYAVPLLKGTWMTSPYKEDAAPATTNVSVGGGREGSSYNGASTPGYHIDQNTFATGWNFNSTAKVTQTVDQFAGLCLKCHPKSSIAPGTNSAWKSIDRIHNSVKGWGTFGANNGNAIHAYTCSKCHTPHNSSLPRMLVTDCLDYKHRGQVASGGTPGSSGAANSSGWGWGMRSGGDGQGTGGFPAGGSGSGKEGGGTYFFGARACHDNTNTAKWPANQLWNTKSPW